MMTHGCTCVWIVEKIQKLGKIQEYVLTIIKSQVAAKKAHI